MSLDPALVEAAILRKDAHAVRDLLKDATESDRRACAKALKDLLKGPGIPDYGMMMTPVPRLVFPEHMMVEPPSAALLRRIAEHNREAAMHEDHFKEQRRPHQEWHEIAGTLGFRLAVVGLAGGVAAAARALDEFSYSFDDVSQSDDLIIAVLADRRPDWLADLVDRYLRQGGIAAWPLARGLVRLGVIARPSVAEYTTLMPFALELSGAFLTLQQALLADPGLFDDEVWRLFTVPDAGGQLETADYRGPESTGETWSQALAVLSAEGYLDRSRLIDACLDAFNRDFNPNRVSWYATTLTGLDLSIDEMTSRSSKYLGLLAATSKTAITLGQASANRLLDAGRLEAAELLAASAPALLFPQKNIAMAQLKLIDKVAAKGPEAVALATAAAAVAFAHQRQDIQEAALALIRKYGVPSGPAFDEIRSRVPDLSAALGAQAAALGLPVDQAKPAADACDEIAELERRVAALSARSGLAGALSAVRRGEVPGPAEFKPDAGAELPPPITDPDELVHLLSILIEDAGDAISVERALGAVVRLSALPQRQRQLAAAPLLKRAETVMHDDAPFAGDVIASDIALLTWAWAGEPLPRVAPRESTGLRHDDHCDYAVSGTGQALTMAGIFSARAWEAARMIEAGRGGLLLAEPETDRGTISPARLLERMELLARQGDGPRNQYDRDVALLRLAPGATDALWRAWAALHGTAAEAARETYRAITTPLNFETVAGQPVESEIWRRYLEPVLLARTTGQVPIAADCPSWQLLTRLADPLADHGALTDVGRYWYNYDEAVAGWSIICPWQPEVAAAHLLRPLSAGLTSRTTPATAAIRSLHHRGHALGPVGHLALIEAMSGIEADTRIAASEVWSAACADGRLDPVLAAAALTAGTDCKLVKLNRVAESMERASHSALAGRRVVETVCAATDLIAAAPPNLHLLIELAARLGSSFGVPALPDEVGELATRRRGARLNVTAAQLVQAAERQPAGQRQAAVQALTALVTRAESLVRLSS
jgi:hypothetical protein